jgi:hypothetical protein
MGVFGYLDASSGSMLVGAVAAGAAGVAVAAKVGWRRVTGVFGKKGDDVESVDADGSVSDVVEPADPAADPS